MTDDVADEQGLRVRAVQHRAVEDAVGQVVDAPGRRQVRRVLRTRPYHRGVEAHRDGVAGRHRGAQRRSPEPVRQVEMVRGTQGRHRIRTARGVHPGSVPQERAAPRLVERDPLLHAVAERLADDLRVLGEPQRRVALGPAARVLQLLGEVPVVEGERRLDAAGQQLVDQTAVEVQAALDGGAAARRLHPGPGHREAVRGQAQLRHHRHVVAVAVVVVVGDVAGLAARRLAGRMAEGVPDRGRTAVLPHRPLDLVRGGRRAPEKGGREGHGRCGLRHGSAPMGGKVVGDQGYGVGEGRGEGAEAAAARPLRPGAAVQPLIAPCMIPPTICLPNSRKAMSSGRVPRSAPAMITAWSGT